MLPATADGTPILVRRSSGLVQSDWPPQSASSIGHDIIVKQHSGSIEVNTEPGAFTEFRIVLPRAGASLMKSRERL